MRRVNSEALVTLIPSCGGLKTTDVGAVSQLCLCITANDLVLLSLLEEELVLLRCALITQSLQEHGSMKTIGSRFAQEVVGNSILLVGPVVLDLELAQTLALGKGGFNASLTALKVVL